MPHEPLRLFPVGKDIQDDLQQGATLFRVDELPERPYLPRHPDGTPMLEVWTIRKWLRDEDAPLEVIGKPALTTDGAVIRRMQTVRRQEIERMDRRERTRRNARRQQKQEDVPDAS